jgi:signal transduction histidine kinase
VRKGDEETTPSIPSQTGYSARIAEGQKNVFVLDTDEQSSFEPPWVQDRKVKSFAGIPLLFGGNTVGLLYVNYADSHDFSEYEKKLIQLLANQSAVAIENARLYYDLKKNLQELKQTREKLVDAEKMLVMSRFATDFIHRVNNLVGTIPIWAQQAQERLQEREALDAEINRLLSNIIKDVRRVRSVTKQLIEATKQKPQSELIDVVELVRTIARRVRVLTPDEIQTLEELPEKQVFVEGIYIELETTIWDLAWNAVEAIRPIGSGTLTLSVVTIPPAPKSGQGRVRISVHDNGTGVPEEYVVFELSSTKPDGLGYGLWRAKKVVQEFEGVIDFQSIPGDTTFWIEMPVAEGE